MFRISQYMRILKEPPRAVMPARTPPGPVVIWNLVRRCNLACRHCYSISADKDFPGELSTQEILAVMKDLRAFGVPALILSGGEPLLRPDIFEISRHARALGFYVGLSTNGTLIDENNIRTIAETGYDYVGISLDGMHQTHDRFRRKRGAFDASLRAIRLCRDAGIRVGMRFTPTQETADELPQLLDLMREEGVDKFYLSHLNYGGRGNRNRRTDVLHQATRHVMDRLFERCWQDIEAGRNTEYVSGNNDADAVYLLHWIRRHHPGRLEEVWDRLAQWGGNASGVHIANIDNLGNVHPDTFWWNYNLGNVRERPFSEIWEDRRDPLMYGLKRAPRPLRGRCRVCRYQDICGGNTRVRAFQLTGDPWWEDPACYLTDEELGIEPREYAGDRPQAVALDTHVIRFNGLRDSA
ncbi:MAG TPA: heme d1 biosynthesis radical SAM protein NirJ [Gammaproteobacteria bacterium]|nr:heme d1 biosynthesis radical SAM protein NirJ [Gammaproteobacteria bacterium]